MFKSVGRKSLLIGRHKSSSKDGGDEQAGDDTIVWRWYLVEEMSPDWLRNEAVRKGISEEQGMTQSSGSSSRLKRCLLVG
ncbi:hypothetical protein TNCV_4426511 [Trichonephila clavipes]|nr:hypothetical protein TNCV_4426511 [Trichonephila clavipes]